MFEPNSRHNQIEQKENFTDHRKAIFAGILIKIKIKQKLNMHEVRIYESLTRESRLDGVDPLTSTHPYTVLVFQDDISYIERVSSDNCVNAMNQVCSDPRFEDSCSVKACYPGHFADDFSFEIDESEILI